MKTLSSIRKLQKNQLKEHEVTVADNWPEARKLLKKGNFEAVLSDLMLPATHDMLSDEAKRQYRVGTLMPLGFIVALHACLVPGVKYVAVITDSNHHSDPVSAGLDYTGEFSWYYDTRTPPEPKPVAPFNINGVKGIFSFAPMKGTTEKEVKDWAKALDVLLNG